MRFVFVCAIGLAFACIIALGLGLGEVMNGRNDIGGYPTGGTLTALLAVFASFALTLALVLGIIRILKAVANLVLPQQRIGRTDGPNALQKLIALAIVAIIFQELAFDLFRVALDFITIIAADLPRNVIESAYDLGRCSDARSAECFFNSLNVIFRPLALTAQDILNRGPLQSVRLDHLIIASALWAFLIYLLSDFQKEESIWSGIDDETKRNGAYLGICLIAAYLGISALLAFALFDNDEGAKIADSVLEEQAKELDEALTAVIQLNSDNGVSLGERSASSAFITADTFEKSRYNSIRHSLEATATNATAAIEQASAEAKSLKIRTIAGFKNENSGRQGEREMRDHSAKITSWFVTINNDQRQRTADCRASFSIAVSALADLRAIATSSLPQVTAASNSEDPTPLSKSPAQQTADLRAFENTIGYVQQSHANARSSCAQLTIYSSSIPRRDLFGASLGPVAAWTSWLLRSESKQLSLIIGLIGFGLLGATASTYFRSAPNRETPTAIIGLTNEAAAVLVKGFVAAIVVYLSATGGLAVVGDGDGGSPNPYIVFAACLVGAVFSEDVWEWARDKLTPKSKTGGKLRDETVAGG